MPLREVISRFKEAGLGSIPGGGGEILVDSVRQRIAPLKCKTDQWLEVMQVAHELGTEVERHDDVRPRRDDRGSDRTFAAAARSTGPERWVYCLHLLDLSTGEHGAEITHRTGSAEYLRTQALARIFLDNIPNIQSSWVTQGPEIGQIALKYGANDFGSVMMEENVVSSAGTTFRLNAAKIEDLIREAGYAPRRRNNWYELI
jgi:cyclic dehypoxanthinyl futalosine synthase